LIDINLTGEYNLGKRRNSALRTEQEQFTMISNKQNQTFYKKHTTRDDSNTINFGQAKQKKPINLIPKTVNQEQYILALQNAGTDIVVVSGPAGTGKTYLAMLAAIKALRSKEYDRIVLTRPAVGVDDEKHGFLPGDLNAKMEPWTRPLLDVLREFYTAKEVEYMLEEQVVEISPLAFMRGRTFKNAFIILDEGQNATPSQVKMLLTRIGVGSKIVVTGDTDQADRKAAENGLLDLRDKLKAKTVNGIECCEFDHRDIQRHRIIGDVLRLYR
jgi:phosphate starvation-inducible PhoH-like protein